MAQQQDFFFNQLRNAAQLQAAQSGGYDPSVVPGVPSTPRPSFGRQALNVMGAIAPAVAAAPQAGLIPALLQAAGGYAQMKNVQDYNRFIQAQYLQELQRQKTQDANNSSIWKRRTGQEIQGPFDLGFANQSAQDIRKSNATDSVNAMLGGGALRQDQYGDYDPAMIRDYVTRQAQVQDANATLNQLPQWMGGGVPGASKQRPAARPGQPMLDSVPRPTLQSGVSADNFGEMNPYMMGVPNVSQLLTGRSSEQSSQLGNRKAAETERNNRATESIGRTNASANMMRANKYQPGGGGLQNPYTVPKAQQDFLQNQIEAIDKQLTSLGINTKDELKPRNAEAGSGGFFGVGALSPADARKNKAINRLIERRNQLLGAVGGSPFGDTGAAQLRSAGEWLRTRGQ